MIDYHLHTPLCCHASGSLEEYLEEAERKKLSEIGFADHFPLGLLGYTPRNQVTMNPDELEDYIRQVEKLKTLSSDVTIKLGVEVDYIPGTETKLSDLLDTYSFDYTIGSVHFMDGWDFTHPVYAKDYENKNIESLYCRYFELVRDACCTGLFDIIGHIDVIKKFGYRLPDKLTPLWLEIVSLLGSTGTVLELNTAGRDALIGEFYPDTDLLKACRAENVPVTLGSDAHGPDQVGRYFNEAINILRAAGYSELTVFNRRAKSTVSI